ncbi:MFS transporter, partial [Candidatus Gracilibacteria bacterium]|nr:MFS transporter [Candidatus Gracilibacteria bacterium]
MSQNTVIIAPNTGFTGYRLRNFYMTNAFQGFVWMVFHFAVVYFFTLILDNIALVGIFLGIANFVSFLLDIPLGTLQRYISTKKLFILGGISQFIAILVFFFFILNVFNLIEAVGQGVTKTITDAEKISIASQWFFGDLMHWIALLIAAVCYGFTKEVNEVTTFGYVLSNSHPSRTGQIIARANITFGVGSVIGMVLSGFILSIGEAPALIFLGLVIIGFLAFTLKYFDNSLDSINISDIKEFTVSVQKWDANETKKQIVQTIQKADLGKIVENTKYIFMKPKQKKEKKEKIPWKDIMEMTKTEMRIIWEIFSQKPLQFGLIWTISLVLIFGFWDTFASSFLLDFLEKVKPGGSYILLAIIGVPGVLLQDTVSRFTEKIGAKTIGIVGLILSSGSIFVMGLLAMGQT